MVVDELNVLIVFNTDDSKFLSNNSKLKVIPSSFPRGTCKQNIYYLCATCASEVANYLDEYDIDLVVYFGLGRGLLWHSDSFRNVVTICDDTSFIDLFGGSTSFNRKVLHELVAPTYKQIDYKKCWPKNVKLARTREDLAYITNRCMQESMGLDTETNFLNPFLESPAPFLVCFSVAWHSDEQAVSYTHLTLPTNREV